MDNFDSTQLEQLRAIGAYLYEVRQDQQRTLEEISAKTYIPLRILKALEAGQEKILPEPVFVQGFIRRYADALGLDGLELAQQFPIHTRATVTTEDKPSNGMVDEPIPSSSSRNAVTEAPSAWEPSRRRRERPSYVPYVAIGAIAVVALGALMMGRGQPDSQSEIVTNAEPEGVPVEPAPPVAEPDPASEPSVSPSPASNAPTSPSPSPTSPASSASPAASPNTTSSPSPARSTADSDAPVTVDVSLTDRSWLQVVVDGEIEFEGILAKGEKQSWSAQEEITIVAGNAGGVMVGVNEAQAQTMGAMGQVSERTFTATNANTQSSP